MKMVICVTILDNIKSHGMNYITPALESDKYKHIYELPL